MPYFWILPFFAAAMLGGVCLLGVCRLVPALQRAQPYVRRMLIGSSLGFVLANLASLLFGVVPVLIASALGVSQDSPGAQVAAAFALLGLFIGPLIASPLGVLGGAWIGLERAWRAESVPRPQLAPVRQ